MPLGPSRSGRFPPGAEQTTNMLRRTPTWLILGFAVLAAGGCAKKRIPITPLAAPIVVARAMEEVVPPEIDARPKVEPPWELVIPPPSPGPPPPHRASIAPAPAPEPENAEVKPPAPRMAPRLEPGEENTYKQKTWDAISGAETNLRRTNGHRLNAIQQDLEGKVRGFLGQSREAIGVGDWILALNLAEKALLLSRELVGSLRNTR